MKNVYQSWLRRTSHINCDCSYCGNQRYSLNYPLFMDQARDDRPTIYACPSCNFEDLQITQKVDYIPLHLFVLAKAGMINPQIL